MRPFLIPFNILLVLVVHKNVFKSYICIKCRCIFDAIFDDKCYFRFLSSMHIQYSICTVGFDCLMSVVMTSKCKVLFQAGCRGMLADAFCLAGNPCRAANKLAGMIKGDMKWFQPSKSVHSVSILLQLLFLPVC